MSEPARPPSERWSAASGLVFVALFIGWLALYRALEPAGGQPRPGDAEIVSDVLEGQDRLHVAHFVVGLAAAAWLWFLGSLCAALKRAEGGTGRLSEVAFAAGVVFAVLLLVAGALLPGLADVPRRGGTLDPRAAAVVYDLAGSIFSLAPFSIIVLVGATSLAALRYRALPPWLGWVGGVVIVLLVAGAASIDLTRQDPLWFVGILGMVLWLAWVATISLTLVLRRRSAEGPGRRTTPEADA